MTPSTQIIPMEEPLFFQQSIVQYLFDRTSCLYLNGDLDWRERLQKKDCKPIITLSLQYCRINDQKFQYFVKLQWKSLRKLQLCYNNLTINSLKLLISQQKFKNLTRLQIGNNKISSQCIKILTKSQLPQLIQLCLCKTDICNQGIKHMIKNRFKKLIKLNLKQNFIGMSGIMQFVPRNQNLLKNFQIFCEQQSEESIVSLQLVAINFMKIGLPTGIKNKFLKEKLIQIFSHKMNYFQQI